MRKESRRFYTSVGFSIEDDEIWNKFRELCYVEDKSKGELIFKAICEYVQKHYPGNPQKTLIPKTLPMRNPPAELRHDRLISLLEIIRTEPGVNKNHLIYQVATGWGLRVETVQDYLKTLGQAGKIVIRGSKVYPRERDEEAVRERE